MELKVIDQTKNKLVIEIKQQGHALSNVLKKELWNDEDVVSAGYVIEHPQISDTKIVIETKGKDPKKALLDALNRLKKTNADFAKKFSDMK